MQIYGTGNVKGIIGSDIVSFGGMSTRMMVISVEEEHNVEKLNADGIYGLGNNENYTHLFESAFETGQIVSPLFAFKVNRKSESSLSYFYYNFTEQDFPNVEYFYTDSPDEDNKTWQLPLKNFIIGSGHYSLGSVSLDTGATKISLPVSLQQQLNEDLLNEYCSDPNIRKDRQRVCYSPQKINYPNLVFQLTNGYEIVIGPEEYVTDYDGKFSLLQIEFS